MITGIAAARPVHIPSIEELMTKASLVAIIHPQSVRYTNDLPDDESFGSRDIKNYRSLETSCKVVTTLKGKASEPTLRIVHFTYGDTKPEFNGGLMMNFLFDPVRFSTFTVTKDSDPERKYPYGSGGPQYLAFLRQLPDGRYAPASSHYDAATSFRLLSEVLNAQLYINHAHAEQEKNKGADHKAAE